MQCYTSANEISETVWVWPMSGVDGFDTVEIHSDVFSPDWQPVQSRLYIQPVQSRSCVSRR